MKFTAYLKIYKTMQTFNFKGQTNINLTSQKIESERIILKSIDDRYAPDICKEFTSEITKYMFPRPAEKIDETLSFISESIDKMSSGNELVLVIIKKENGEFLGVCGLHGKNNTRTPELGIWLKKDAHGRKYGREAIQKLNSWASENIDFDYTVYPVDKANIASRKIPESMGGIIIEEKKEQAMNGNYLDLVIYKISPKVY